jgi:Late embryogenesis abundant protein
MIALTEISPFFQPHRNIRRLDIEAVTNSTQLQDQVAKNLKHDKSTGNVGLEVRVRSRIRLKVGIVKTMRYKLRADCTPVNVGFSPNSATSFDRVYCDVEI